MSSLFAQLSQQLPITDPTWIFLLVLLIILFAPILLNKLRIPHIIGMILAGLAIGEHGLNILARDSSFELFGKVGLYYIMFLAGLEMDMVDFAKNRWRSLLLGVLSFLIPISLGIVANVWLLDYALATSVLLASMYASHTLVTYPIVIRYGIARQRSVSISVGGTAFTDTLTLLVLALVSGFYKGETGQLFVVWLALKTVAVGAFIIYCFPKIGRWFFRRYSDGVMQFIFVLAMVFLSAGLVSLAGLEGILGAFMAGLVLNRLIPHVSPLMNHLEFVGNALFIPYFLIGVGMLVDLKVIFGQLGALKVTAVMLAVALVGKWLACWAMQRLSHMSALERQMMFGLSTARAAATLAAVTVGYNLILPSGERLLNDDVLNGTVLLILITCIVSSLVTEAAAKRIAMDEAQGATGRPQTLERILIPVANPDTIEYHVNLALLIRDPRMKDNLIAVNVVNDNVASDRQAASGRRCLERAGMVAAAADVRMAQISRYGPNVASSIIHTVKENGVTDVIIGLHRKVSMVDSFYGVLTESLLKGLHRQVMIAKFLIPLNTLRRIIVAVPPKAEYEAGFHKWVGQLCRMGSTLGCRVHFFACEATTAKLQEAVRRRRGKTLTDFSPLDDWEDLLMLTGQVNYDHLLVIVTARPGAISYDNAFEKLPHQLSRYFANNSLILLYPDQLGEPQDTITFYNPRGQDDTHYYEKMTRWFYKWFKKQ